MRRSPSLIQVWRGRRKKPLGRSLCLLVQRKRGSTLQRKEKKAPFATCRRRGGPRSELKGDGMARARGIVSEKKKKATQPKGDQRYSSRERRGHLSDTSKRQGPPTRQPQKKKKGSSSPPQKREYRPKEGVTIPIRRPRPRVGEGRRRSLLGIRGTQRGHY